MARFLSCWCCHPGWSAAKGRMISVALVRPQMVMATVIFATRAETPVGHFLSHQRLGAIHPQGRRGSLRPALLVPCLHESGFVGFGACGILERFGFLLSCRILPPPSCMHPVSACFQGVSSPPLPQRSCTTGSCGFPCRF
jgi:hypothetical protein